MWVYQNQHLFAHRRRRNRIAEQIALSGVLRGYRTTEYISLVGRCGGYSCRPAGRRQVMLALAGIAIDANENAIRGVVVLIFARPETNQRNDADGQRAEEKQFGKPVHRASVDRATTRGQQSQRGRMTTISRLERLKRRQ